MTTWTVILMLGVTAIWAALGGAMAYLVAQAPPRASGEHAQPHAPAHGRSAIG
jgi:hypothetical protein